MQMVKVRVKKSGLEKTITRGNYAALGDKVYERLGLVEVDEQGNETPIESPNQSPQPKKANQGDAGAVVDKAPKNSQILSVSTISEEESQFDGMAKISSLPAEIIPPEIIEVKKPKGKPGPKPKNPKTI